MNGGVIFKTIIQYPDRVESTEAVQLKKNQKKTDIKHDSFHKSVM